MKHEKIFSLLTEIVTGICAHRDELNIHVEDYGALAKTMIIRPHMADYGKLVGRKGGTINALKFVAEYAGRNAGLSLNLELQETGIGAPEPRHSPQTQAFDQTTLERLVRETVEWVFARPLPIEFEDTGKAIAVTIDVPRDKQTDAILLQLSRIFFPWGRANGREHGVVTTAKG